MSNSLATLREEMEGMALQTFNSRDDQEGQALEAFREAMQMSPDNLEAARALLSLFQPDAFIPAMLKQRAQGVARRRLQAAGGGQAATRAEQYTIKDMVSFQQDPIPLSLLRMERSLQEQAVKMFNDVLRLMGLADGRPLAHDDEVGVTHRILTQLRSMPPLRDEIFLQLQKQTRSNPYKATCLKAWELFRIAASSFPPSLAISGALSSYFETLLADTQLDPQIADCVLAAWTALDHSLKHGPRVNLPSGDEIRCLMGRKQLMLQIFFCDDSHESVPIDPTTTLDEAKQLLLQRLQLSEGSDFVLYACRLLKPVGATKGETSTEHLLLDQKRYVGDVLSDFREISRVGTVTCKLLLKKKIFNPRDATVEDPEYIRLCYSQLKADYQQGYYSVTEEGAVLLCALQIAAELGIIPDAETSLDWSIEMKKSIPRAIFRLQTKDQWMAKVLEQYKALWTMDYEETVREFVRIILEIPHGGSAFFDLKTISDSAKLLPSYSILAVNHNGLHFLDYEIRSVMYEASLKDVSEYDGKADRIFFNMQVHGRLESFEFLTTGGDEVCSLLDLHIENALRDMQQR